MASGTLFGKILVVISEDWFALSHFRPLLAELRELSRELVIVTRSSGRLPELAALGARPLHLDMHRGSRDPLATFRTSRALARIVDTEAPDVVHAIAMQCMVTAALALRRASHRTAGLVYHLTGIGYLALPGSLLPRLAYRTAFAVLRRSARCQPWLLAENPDDAALITDAGIVAPQHVGLLPGAGLDLDLFPPQPPAANVLPRVAFVGRMLESKGVRVLVEAQQRLWGAGTQMELALCGRPDGGTYQALPESLLQAWQRLPGVTWRGHVDDVAGLWRHADIAAVPSLGGEGLPRAMLEAAASARPIVASDIPGCRHFLRPGVEGLLVPPGDAGALAAALGELAGDPDRRAVMGAAARQRVATGYGTAQFRAAVRDSYTRLSYGTGRNRARA